MFIHLGGGRMIRLLDVIAILDAGVEKSPTMEFSVIEVAKRFGRLEQLSTEEIKSYVVTNDRVYASSISSLTLKKRAQSSQIYMK